LVQLPLLVLQGAWTEAWQIATHVIEFFPFGPSGTVIYAEVALGTIARAQGDTETAWAIIRRRLPLGAASDPTATVALCAFDLARLAAALAIDGGELAMAQAWLDAHDRWLAASGRVLGAAEGQILWARCYQRAGDLARATAYGQAALARATAPRQPVALLASYRILGELATAEGHLTQAEQNLTAALDLANLCAAPFERALTLLALAEMHAGSGAHDQATPLLDEIRNICEPLGARPSLDRVATLATQLAVATQLNSRSAGLTPREVEVLRLVVEGHSDPEIAQRLVIGSRTVQSHVTSILAKLEVSSRTAAATYAVRHGLV
jgi:ATP/maltotriose-dependent transcriptional regulator MalT